VNQVTICIFRGDKKDYLVPRKIYQFSNGGSIEFDTGNFDDWCVFVTRPNGERFAPTDIQYFKRLSKLGTKHGSQKIYDDFVVIFNRTSKELDASVPPLIADLSRFYGDDALEMEIWLNVIYAGMIAEENKENAILKKRVKRLGMHQLLVEHMKPEKAASFSKGKKWRELDAEMKKRGF
jgi:hypothetical protein